jgi:hypothetical protein
LVETSWQYFTFSQPNSSKLRFDLAKHSKPFTPLSERCHDVCVAKWMTRWHCCRLTCPDPESLGAWDHSLATALWANLWWMVACGSEAIRPPAGRPARTGPVPCLVGHRRGPPTCRRPRITGHQRHEGGGPWLVRRHMRIVWHGSLQSAEQCV